LWRKCVSRHAVFGGSLVFAHGPPRDCLVPDRFRYRYIYTSCVDVP
jgi:hypothetical protein